MSCAPCRIYLEQLGMTIDMLRELPGEPGRAQRASLMATFEAWAAQQPDREGVE